MFILFFCVHFPPSARRNAYKHNNIKIYLFLGWKIFFGTYYGAWKSAAVKCYSQIVVKPAFKQFNIKIFLHKYQCKSWKMSVSAPLEWLHKWIFQRFKFFILAGKKQTKRRICITEIQQNKHRTIRRYKTFSAMSLCVSSLLEK